MIIDCFPFFNELDLLEIRVNELAGVVDYFVLTEATLTHSGKPKPLYFQEHKERFAGFPIVGLVIDSYDTIDTSWSWNLERYQRQYGVTHAMNHFALTTNDTLISGDADEIPAAAGVQAFQHADYPVACLNMELYFYYLNCYCPKRPWWYAKICHPTLPKVDSYRLRGHGHQPTVPRINPGGWHFTWFGDIEYKLASYAHQERNAPPFNDPTRLTNNRDTLQHIYNQRKRVPLTVREGYAYLPQYVQDHLPRFQQYLRVRP